MKVLHVEDYVAAQRIIGNVLTELGHELTTCTDAETGLELYRREKFPCIVMDIMLPGMNGLELCRHIRREPEGDRPVILVCTGWSSADKLASILVAGANDYLAKPVQVDLLKVRLIVAERQVAEIAKRKALEEQTELIHVQKLSSLSRMAAGLAHEINTPTQYLSDNARFLQSSFAELQELLGAYAKLLDEARSGPPRREVISRIEGLTRRIDTDYLNQEIPRAINQSLEGIGCVTRIVRAMMEFSRPATEAKMATDINRAIENAVTVSAHVWKRVADVKTDLDPAMPLVPCFPGDLNQVLLNIIDNAAHAIGDAGADEVRGRGTIEITTRREEGWVEIAISDTGTGIPEDVREKIYDPFFTTKEEGKGRGQGLAIAYSIVTVKHGGTISMRTEMGKGTSFAIRLPMETAAIFEGACEAP